METSKLKHSCNFFIKSHLRIEVKFSAVKWAKCIKPSHASNNWNDLENNSCNFLTLDPYANLDSCSKFKPQKKKKKKTQKKFERIGKISIPQI